MKKVELINDDIVKWANNYNGPLFSALITDPPYEMSFMSKNWDSTGVAFDPETWVAIKRCMLPGAFGMAFSSSRTWHRLAVAIEDAGFVIHPTIWLWGYGSGFPKATNISGQIDDPTLKEVWKGHRYGRQALKPAAEPIIVFSKAKEICYNELQEQLNIANVVLEELWQIHAKNQSVIDSAAHGINTILLKALENQTQTYKESGLSAEIAKTLSTNLQERYGSTVESVEGIAPGNVTSSIEQNSPIESAKTAEKNFQHEIHLCPQNIAAESVPALLENNLCYLTLSEMGIDTSTKLDILQSSLEKAKLDLSTIWLWRLVLADLCETASKSTIATAEKMITELRILNYLLRKLTPKNQDTPLERNLLDEQWLYARDVTQNFIGLLTFLMEQQPTAKNVVDPIIVFQKPYEGRPLDNITETGAGALNIDGTRIGVNPNGLDDPRLGGNGDWSSDKAAKNVYEGGYVGNRVQSSALGRWPSNLVLQHHPDCKKVGVESDGGYTINRWSDGAKPFGGGAGHKFEGKEIESSVDVWACVEDCPVRALNIQSGNSISPSKSVNYGAHKTQPGASGTMGLGWNGDKFVQGHGDKGGASRYFFNFQEEQIDESQSFIYNKKVSPSERDAGLEKNIHPTLKPITLARYLATMLLPPKEYSPRRILIPFAGVASEMTGAALAGWEEIIGVELDADHVEIGQKRLQFWLSRPIATQTKLFGG